MFALLISCKKDPEVPTGSNKILVGITTADTVSYLFAKVSTQLNGTGGNQISQHGHCWNTESSPDINDSHTSFGGIDGPGKVTSDLSGLLDNTKYFIRPYFTFQGGTVYGIQKEIKTLKRGRPVVFSGMISDLTTSSVKISGIATLDSGFTITQKGICWDTAANPTLLKAIGHSEEGANTGYFISSISNLSNNNHYYYCAFATNERGTSYGEVKQFMTIEITLPTVSTLDITSITANSALCGGFVTNSGTGTVSGRGVCWNTSGNPTLTNCINKTQDGSGIGNYSSQINGLLQGTTYYVAAYATNEKGTSYGEGKQFTALPIVIPTVITLDITSIMNTTATSGGNITNAGNGSVTVRGVCWSISPNPTLSNNHTSNGAGTGAFVSNLTNLTANTKYYVRAYSTNEAGTGYGNEVTFTTLPNPILPTVTTTTVTNITQTTAKSGGNVTSDGGSTITTRGVCWSTSSNPTTVNSKTVDGTGTGSFISNLTGLTANSQYYIRAYATNSVGTGYGNEQVITTLPNPVLPTITTTSVTNITQTTATSGGNVISDGGASVTARGVCWSSTPNPNTSNSHTNNGTGTGAFVSNLIGLTPSTLYYVRAYATNSSGTSYGNQVSFNTAPFSIGQNYGGGIIFYIDGTGQHGLISATSDQSVGAIWGCYQTLISGTSTAIGTGQTNTIAIVNGCSQTGTAARICNDLVFNGYDDWFLPSRDELTQLESQKSVIGGFSNSFYWSSSEMDAANAWCQYFNGASPSTSVKTYTYHVRAIRAF